jgi:hypothetical protein
MKTVHQILIDFKKAYDSVSREVIYIFLIGFGVPIKLVRLIKMCLSETYIKVSTGKYLSDNFPIQKGLNQGDALSPLLFNFDLEYAGLLLFFLVYKKQVHLRKALTLYTRPYRG